MTATRVMGMSLSLLLHAAANLPQYADQLAFDRTSLDYDSRGRRLGSMEWAPIRIYVHADELNNDLLDQQVRAYVRDDVMQAVVRWLSLVLRVRPVLGRLQFEKHCSAINLQTKQCVQISKHAQTCGEATIPNDHFRDREYCPGGIASGCKTSRGGPGVSNADIALYVTARDTGSCVNPSTVAYATACRQDASDRPIAGHLNFCKSHLVAHRSWQKDLSTAVHEIIHTLGFTSSLFAFFRDDNGAPRTPRDQRGMPPIEQGAYRSASGTILPTTLADGTGKHYVVLPRVLDAARQHFSCSTLDRVPLEEVGGDGSAFSHWDERVLHTETMTPTAGNYPLVSSLTLALLEDSGWYKVDYMQAGEVHFGRGQGCNFVTKSCIQAGSAAFPNEFCSAADAGRCGYIKHASSQIRCTPGRLAKALCTGCFHSQPLPPKFQYFADPRLGGTQHALGFCPVWDPYTTNGMRSYCHEGRVGGEQSRGETHGPSSRCIMSTVVAARFMPPAQPQGSCRQVLCEKDVLYVMAAPGISVACKAGDEGKRKRAGRDWNGEIVCPSYAEICGRDGHSGPRAGATPCLFPGVPRNGRCVCPSGVMHEDCSVLDLQTNRALYPYGLQYAQDDLSLQADTPLSRSSGVLSWPLRAKLVSGPTALRFAVYPPLPTGIFLRASDGALLGTPTVAVARSAYTILACSQWGGASTTLFISVSCAEKEPDCAVELPASVGDVPTCKSIGGTGNASETSASDRSVLRMSLQNILFHNIQVQPGLEMFMSEFSVALSKAVNHNLSVSYVSATSAGFVDVEFHLEDGNKSEAIFSGVVRRLISSLDDGSSALRQSSFGRRYLVQVELYQITKEGILKLWPEPKEETAWQEVVRRWREWLPYVAGALLVSSVCLQLLNWALTKMKARRRREAAAPKSRQHASRSAPGSPCVAKMATWTAFLSILAWLVVFGDRLWTMFMVDGYEVSEVSFSLDVSDWHQLCLLSAGALLIVSTLMCCIESCLHRRRRDEDVPTQCEIWWARVLTAAYLVAMILIVIVVISKFWDQIPGTDKLTFFNEMSTWQQVTLASGGGLIVLFACMTLAHGCQKSGHPSYRTGSAEREDVSAALRDAAEQRDVAPVVLGIPSSPPAAPTEHDQNRAVSQMLDMGFDYDQSLRCLRTHGWDVKRAVDALSIEVHSV